MGFTNRSCRCSFALNAVSVPAYLYTDNLNKRDEQKESIRVGSGFFSRSAKLSLSPCLSVDHAYRKASDV